MALALGTDLEEVPASSCSALYPHFPTLNIPPTLLAASLPRVMKFLVMTQAGY